MAMGNYIHRDFVHDNSMSSLLTPVSLTEYAIRREHFGEGMLGITEAGLKTAGASQKYRIQQKQLLDRIAYEKKMDELYGSEKTETPQEESMLKPLTPSADPIAPPSRWQHKVKSPRGTMGETWIPGNVGCNKTRHMGSIGPKPTNSAYQLHGVIGTGNKHSSYNFRKGDRSNTVYADTFLGRRAKRVTTEERKILRALVAFSLRGLIDFVDTTQIRKYQVKIEKMFIEQFLMNPAMKTNFFTDELFARKLVDQQGHEVVKIHWLDEYERKNGKKFVDKVEEARKLEELAKQNAGLLQVPGRHAVDCGPSCYCLKHQDAAIKAPRPTEEAPPGFHDLCDLSSTLIAEGVTARAQRTVKRLNKSESVGAF